MANFFEAGNEFFVRAASEKLGFLVAEYGLTRFVQHQQKAYSVVEFTGPDCAVYLGYEPWLPGCRILGADHKTTLREISVEVPDPAAEKLGYDNWGELDPQLVASHQAAMLRWLELVGSQVRAWLNEHAPPAQATGDGG